VETFWGHCVGAIRLKTCLLAPQVCHRRHLLLRHRYLHANVGLSWTTTRASLAPLALSPMPLPRRGHRTVVSVLVVGTQTWLVHTCALHVHRENSGVCARFVFHPVSCRIRIPLSACSIPAARKTEHIAAIAKVDCLLQCFTSPSSHRHFVNAPDFFSSCCRSAGEYTKDKVECVLCESGRYAPQPQTGSCLLCLAGSHTNRARGATTCSPCDSGRWSSDGAVNCSACPAGSFSTSGQVACEPCDCGRFADSLGSPTCSECAAGRFSAALGAVNCIVCTPGKYQSATGGKVCFACLPGKFSEEHGALSCQECPRGYSSSGGALSCGEEASENYFLFRGVATACPKHTTCIGRSFMPQPEPGYWVDRRDLAFAKEIYKCHRASCNPSRTSSGANTGNSTRRLGQNERQDCWKMDAYRSSDETSSESESGAAAAECSAPTLLCSEGNRGPLCSSCEPLWTYSSAERICIKCSTSLERTLLMLCVGVFVLSVLGFLHTSAKLEHVPSWILNSTVVGSLRQIDHGAFRVIFSNFQASVSLDHPEYLCVQNSNNDESLSTPKSLGIRLFKASAGIWTWHSQNHFRR
jgi:hypothetical protein